MNDYINNQLKKLNFSYLTTIQSEVLKNFFRNSHLISISPTGTGKTHAYLFPIIKHIHTQHKYIQAIIIIPTNELVFQIEAMLKEMKIDNLNTTIIYGSVDSQKLIKKLKKEQTHIIITTPQKLFEYTINKPILKIKNTKFIVFDEADILFKEEFLTFLKPSISLIKIKPKILSFSATFPEKLQINFKKLFGKTHIIDLQKKDIPKIKYFLLKSSNKLNTLIKLTKIIQPFLALIFVSHKKDQLKIFEMLQKQKINVLNFSADLSVKKRKQYLKDINKFKYQYILTSDLAARGLDLKASLIINYDLPTYIEFFQHRCGRTGRINKEGETITIYEEKDIKIILQLQKKNFNFKLITLSKNHYNIITK